MNKRGISAVVTTLIIILLSIVMLGVLWVVVKNILDKSAEEIDLGKATLDLEIQTVKIQDTEVTVVVVRRNPGKGEFIGMYFVFSDGENSEVIRLNTSLVELEQREFMFTLTKFLTTALETVSVIPIYMTSSGKESQGNLADTFEISDKAKEGVTAAVVTNFKKLGYSGAGKMEYGPFSSNTPNLVEFKKAIVDPLDVLPGDNQSFTVHVYSPNGITSVTSVTELDNSTLNLDFAKIDEYIEDSKTIEIWSVSWIVNDTHTTTYRTLITATDSLGNENMVTLTWTDSCQSQITHGGADAIATSCSTGVNGIDGLDGGTLTINSGITLTIDSGAIWAFNAGTSILPIGTITVNGEIRKGNLFYIDADSDNYGKDTTLSYSTLTSVSGKVRAKDALGTGDLCDTDPNAHPGISIYSSSQTACGNYDWNTDGSETKRWTIAPRDVRYCNFFSTCTAPQTVGTGWDGSAAACGSSATYITSIGDCTLNDFSPCSPSANSVTGPRTQTCR